MINKKLLKNKIENLWNGSKNTTGTCSLSKSIQLYDFIAITISQRTNENPHTFLVKVSDIVYGGQQNFTIMQSPSIYAGINGRFINATTFDLQGFQKGTWTECYLLSIDGIII